MQSERLFLKKNQTTPRPSFFLIFHKVVGLVEAGYHVFSALFATFLLSLSFRRNNNQTLSCWRVSSPGIYEDTSDFSL